MNFGSRSLVRDFRDALYIINYVRLPAVTDLAGLPVIVE